MKVFEIMQQTSLNDIQFQGFTLHQDLDDYDDDVKKITHYITPPGGIGNLIIDHSPYQFIDSRAFKRYVAFYKKNKRFPSRRDVGAIGPFDNKSVEAFVSGNENK